MLHFDDETDASTQPKALRDYTKDIETLVATAHAEFTQLQKEDADARKSELPKLKLNTQDGMAVDPPKATPAAVLAPPQPAPPTIDLTQAPPGYKNLGKAKHTAYCGLQRPEGYNPDPKEKAGQHKCREGPVVQCAKCEWKVCAECRRRTGDTWPKHYCATESAVDPRFFVPLEQSPRKPEPAGGSGIPAPHPLSAATTKTKASLVETTRSFVTLFSVLEQERKKWWDSPAKQKQRRDLLDKGDSEKLKTLQVINNNATGMIIDMRTKIGVWAKYALGVEVEDLEPEE